MGQNNKIVSPVFLSSSGKNKWVKTVLFYGGIFLLNEVKLLCSCSCSSPQVSSWIQVFIWSHVTVSSLFPSCRWTNQRVLPALICNSDHHLRPESRCGLWHHDLGVCRIKGESAHLPSDHKWVVSGYDGVNGPQTSNQNFHWNSSDGGKQCWWRNYTGGNSTSTQVSHSVSFQALKSCFFFLVFSCNVGFNFEADISVLMLETGDVPDIPEDPFQVPKSETDLNIYGPQSQSG